VSWDGSVSFYCGGRQRKKQGLETTLAGGWPGIDHALCWRLDGQDGLV
jgi:hypothetical protein